MSKSSTPDASLAQIKAMDETSRASLLEEMDSVAMTELSNLQQKDRAAGRRAFLPASTLVSSMSEYVQGRFYFDQGQHISFKRRPWQVSIYDSEYAKRPGRFDPHMPLPVRGTVLKTARQCEKSTSLGNKLFGYAALIPNSTGLFVTSADLNLLEFVDERIDNVYRLSDALRSEVGKLVSSSRYLKRLQGNNSKLVFRSANRDAARSRGIAADIVAIDEIQDMVQAFLPIILATKNNSALEYGPITLMSGTPLTLDNPLEKTWRNATTQNQWMTQCQSIGCKKWNPPGLDQIGPRGMVCSHCGKPLNPLLHGVWVRNGRIDAPMEGYHLSRAIMPYTVAHRPDLFTARWKDLVADINSPTITFAQINNEILGESFDSGKKFVKESDLRTCCNPGLSMSRLLPDRVRHDASWPKFAGIDWGEGTGNGAYTVVCIGYVNRDKMRFDYFHRYAGTESDPSIVKRDLVQLLEDNNITLVGADAGMGYGMNDHLWDNLAGGRNRVVRMRYVGEQTETIRVDEFGGIIQIHKPRWMTRVGAKIEQRHFVLPRWDEFSGERTSKTGFAEDFLSIFREDARNSRTGSAEMRYNHSSPDDSFHAFLYCYTAMLMHYGRIHEFDV